MGKIISDEGGRNLINYKYRGGDFSLIYKYLLTPLNEFILAHLIPLWLAPNLITLIGLAATVVSHVVAAYYSPTFSEVGPWWMYILFGVSLFVYQTLDNIDGKQARRTGSSSPLGLLFDHGCDALNCTISTCTFASTLLLGPTWKSVALWMTTTVTFFFATWEEYYTGELNLPVINGPTEGVLFACIVHISTGLVADPKFWLDPCPLVGGHLNNNTVVLVLSCLLAGITVVSHMIRVSAKIVRDRRAASASASAKGQSAAASTSEHQPASLYDAYSRLVPFVLLNGGLIAWLNLSQVELVSTHPRLFLWTFGLLMSKAVTELMIAHLCHLQYRPLSKTLSIAFFVMANILLVSVAPLVGPLVSGTPVAQYIHPTLFAASRTMLVGTITEEVLLLELCIIAAITYANLIVRVINEVTTLLKIRCFVIVTKKTD